MNLMGYIPKWTLMRTVLYEHGVPRCINFIITHIRAKLLVFAMHPYDKNAYKTNPI